LPARGLPVSGLVDIERRCADHRFRMTGQRRVVLRVVAEARDHPDVKELCRRTRAIDPKVALSTLYRIVRALETIGVLRRLKFSDGRSRYEIAAKRHHDHLIDIETGRITDFHSSNMERLQKKIARRHGCRIVDHRLDIYVVSRDKNTRQRTD
jgi:Fur family transcriptional regulator, ferric uptake regulator